MKADDRHYQAMKMQPRDLYSEVPEFQAYPLIAAIKYISRAKHKNQERRDLKQGINCLEWCQDSEHEMPELYGTEHYTRFAEQFDGETSAALKMIGMRNYGGAILMLRRRLDLLSILRVESLP